MQGRTALPALLGLLTAGWLVPALAATPAPPPAIVSGTIASVGPDALVVTTAAGPKQVRMTAATRVEVWVPARLADVKVGEMIGVQSRKEANGSLTAVEIHIFPPERRGQVSARQFPWVNGNIMTNAVLSSSVSGVSGQTLTLPYEGGTAKINVTGSTDIRRVVAGTRGDLKAGKHGIALGKANEDGSLTAIVFILDKGR